MKAWATLSGKGGVGRTTVACGAAAALFRAGIRTAVLEADPGFGCLARTLGLSEAAYDLGDLADGRCAPEQALLASPAGPAVVSAPASPAWLPPADGWRRALELLASSGIQAVFFDCGPGYGPVQRSLARSADAALLVCVPTGDCARACARISGELAAARLPARLVLSRVPARLSPDCGVQDLDEVTDTVGAPLLGAVPEQKVPPLTRLGEPGYPADEALSNIGRRLLGETVPLLPSLLR